MNGGPDGTGGLGHRFHPTILREYDIRGIVDETLFTADARAIGAAFGTMILARGGHRIAVGYDGRLSSPALGEAVIEGLRSTGITVLAIGLGPTPMVYFAVHHLETDGGLQVTGSHNPPSHNGFKMALRTGPVYGGAIQEIGDIARRGAFALGEGRVESRDVFAAYIDRLVQDFAGERPPSVVWDAGNGAAGPAMAALARRLPGRHACLFAEVDGRFPNHHPDPTVPENLEALIATVKEGGYEVGIGFDGDGDRIGVVDGKGRIVWGDELLMILAGEILAEYPGATIIADVKASRILFDEVARLGGKPLMWKTGHSLIKAKMAELGAPLSGEMSGHIFYKDRFYGHDDALYVAVRLLRILASGERTLADLKDAMPRSFSTPEVRFECAEERKFGAIEAIRANLEREGATVNGIDGVRVDGPDGWWLLRASNTQAVIVARAESATEAGFQRLKEQVRGHLRRVGIEPPASF